jgi:zinc D-Ala-D-Ala carboxypeptidase
MSFKYFKYSEFDSPDEPGSGEKHMCGTLIQMLDEVRKEYGKPMRINSGYRSKSQNLMVGGKKDSSHLRGYAADISVKSSVDRFHLIWLFMKYNFRRVGVAKTFIHVDVDPDKPQEVMWLY